MIKKYLSTLSLCLMMTLSVNAQEETQQSLLPINEPLTENTGSFTNAVLMTGTNVNGIVATGGKGTATLSLDTDPDAEGVQAYAVAENEVVTFSWVSYQGWVNSKVDNVAILNSEGKTVAGYSYDLNGCSITDVQIGGETAPLFEAFSDQGYVGSKSANGWVAKTGQAYLADNANNTVVTVKVYGKGYVEINLKNEKRSIDKTYSTMLPDGFKVDLASLNITNVSANADRSLGINQLKITSDESTVKFVDYTVNRMLGETVLDSYTATNIEGATITLPQAPWYDANGQKYIYMDDDVNGALAEGAVYNITYKAAEKYAWSMNAVDGEGVILKENVASGETFEGDNVTIGFPRYVRVEVAATDDAAADTLLYSTSAISSQYRKDVAITENNQVVNITYAATDKNHVVYYTEAEDVSSYYLKELTTSNAAVRASQGRAAYLDYDAELVKLPAGVYSVTAGLFDASKGYETSADTVRLGFNRAVALEFAINAVNLSEQTKELVVAKDGYLSWMKGGNANWGLDYLYIQKVSDEVPYVTVNNIAEAKAQANGTPVALTLTDAKVSLSSVTNDGDDFYPSYSYIEDESGSMALARDVASSLTPKIVRNQAYTGTLYGSFAFDTYGRPVFSVTAKTASSALDATPCEVLPTEVAVSDVNTEEGFNSYYGKYVQLTNVAWGKKSDDYSNDYYLIATRTEGEGETAVEVSDSILFYDGFYQFPATLPNFLSFNSINGFVEKFYDGTITFYPFGANDPVVKSAIPVANIGALKDVPEGEDIALTLDKAVVTVNVLGHSGTLMLLEDATGGVQVQGSNAWFGTAGLSDALGLTRDSLEISGTVYCRLETKGMIALNDSTLERSKYTVNPELVAVNPTVVDLNKVLDNNYLNRLLKVNKLSIANKEVESYGYVNIEPYFVQGTDSVGIYDMFQKLEYDASYNPLEIPFIKSVTGIIIEGSEETAWSPATPNTFAPLAIENVVFKNFADNEIFIPTAEAVAKAVSEGWFDGGQTLKSDKKGTIDPTTGLDCEATRMPYAGVKKGNAAKSVTVYVTGLQEIRGFAASTSSTDNRALEISAENIEDNSVSTAIADNAPNVTGVATLALDPEASYIVSFNGVDESHVKGADVALFGIWFVKDAQTVGIRDINANENISNMFNAEVYTINGVKVRNAGQGLNGLKKGVYLINGKKAVVK